MCQISLTSINMCFIFRIRCIRNKSRSRWNVMSVLFVLSPVQSGYNLPIFFHFTTWNYHHYLRLREVITQCHTGSVKPAFRLALFASKFHSLLCSCVFQTFLIGIYSKEHILHETKSRYTQLKHFQRILIFTTCDLLWYFAFYSISFCNT